MVQILKIFLLLMVMTAALGAQILPVPSGGTGATHFTPGGIVIGNGVNALSTSNLASVSVTSGTTNFVITGGSNTLTFSVPSTGNPSLVSSTGTIDINHLFVVDLAGTGVSCLQADALGNVGRAGPPCGTGSGGGGISNITGSSGVGVAITAGVAAISGPIIDAVYDCGLKGDGTTDDSAALQACITNHPGRKILLRHTTAACTPAGNCRPATNYYMGTTTITITGAGTQLVGEGNGKYGGGGTPLYWAPNTTGIIMGPSCTSCEITNLYISGPDNLGHPPAFPSYDQCWLGTSVTSGIFGRWPGIVVTGSSQVVQDTVVTCFNGNGIFVRSANTCSPQTAYTCSEPDLWRITGTYVNGNRGNGTVIEGSDTNVGTTQGTNNFGNELWGILDHNSFGDAHISPHTNGNGRAAIAAGGINHKQAYWIIRTSNVVTACFIGSNTSAPSGFAVNNLISLAGASDPSLNSGSTPFTITAVSPSTPGVACSIPGVSGTNAFGGWVTWNQTGPDVPLISVGPFMGIVSNVSSIARTSGTVTITAQALSTSLTPSDINAIGVWFKIIGTGNPAFDNHVFRPTVVTPGSGSQVTLQFPYLGANIATIVNTGFIYSASSVDIQDPIQNIRSVFDGAMTAGNATLWSETAQFSYRQGPPTPTTLPNPYACGLPSNVGCGAPVVVHGAGPGGADLVTYIIQASYTTRVVLHDAASTTVTNAQVDMGGSWKGGGYWSAAATWINPYMEYTQTTTPLALSSNAVVIGGNIDPNPYIPGSGGDSIENIGFNDPWIGSPTSMNGNTLQGITQVQTFLDVPTGFTIRTGLTQNVNTSLTLQAWDGSTAAPGGTSHTVAFSRNVPGDFEMADGQLDWSGHNVYLRSLDPAATSANYMYLNSGSPLSFQFEGRCPGATANTGLFTINSAGTLFNITHPCPATATANFNSVPLQLYGHAWNPANSTALTAGWALQSIMPANGAAATINTLSIHPTGISNVTSPGVANLATTMVSMDPIQFAALNSMKTNTSLPAGTQAFCSNCTSGANNVCAVGTGSMIATYENLGGNGLNWYCGSGGTGGGINYAAHTAWSGGTQVDTTPPWNNSFFGSATQTHQPMSMVVAEQPTTAWDGTLGHISVGGFDNIINHTANTAYANAGLFDSSIDKTNTGQVIVTAVQGYADDYTGTTRAITKRLSPILPGAQPTAAGANDLYGISGQCSVFGSATTRYCFGAYNAAVHYGTGPMTDLVGTWSGAFVSNTGTNTITNAIGEDSGVSVIGTANDVFNYWGNAGFGQFGVNNSAVHVNNYYGFYLAAPAVQSGSTVNHLYSFVSEPGNGNFGINTITPQNALDVAGDIHASSNIISATSMIAPAFTINKNPPARVGDAKAQTSAIHIANSTGSTTLDIDVPPTGDPTITSSTGNISISGGGSGGGSTSWSDLTAPTQDLSLQLGRWRTVFQPNFSGDTTGGTSFAFQQTGTPGTGTQYYILSSTATSANVSPLNITNSTGNGFRMDSASQGNNIRAMGVSKFMGPVQLTGLNSAPSLATDASGNIIAGTGGGGGPVAISDLVGANKIAFASNTTYAVRWNWNFGTGSNSKGLWLEEAGGGVGGTNNAMLEIDTATSSGTAPIMTTVRGTPNGFRVDGVTGNVTATGTAKLVGPVQLTGLNSAPSLATDGLGNIIAGTGGGGGPTFPITTYTGNYTATAADFASCATKAFNSPAGAQLNLPTATIPPNGQCIKVINYGTVTAIQINAPGRTFNGMSGVSIVYLSATSTTSDEPNSAMIISTGTNYFIQKAISYPTLSDIKSPVTTTTFTMGFNPLRLNYDFSGGPPSTTGLRIVESNTVTTGSPYLVTISSGSPVTTPLEVTTQPYNGFRVTANAGDITAIGTAKFIGPVRLTGLNNAPSLATDATGNIIAGTGGGGGGITPAYSQSFHDIPMSTTAGPVSIGAGKAECSLTSPFTCTAMTPTVDTSYRMVVTVTQTNPGQSCAANGTIQFWISYTDADSGAAINNSPQPAANMGAASFTPNMNMGNNANGTTNMYNILAQTVRLKAGIPLTFRVQQTVVGGSCTPQPTFTMRVAFFGEQGVVQ